MRWCQGDVIMLLRLRRAFFKKSILRLKVALCEVDTENQDIQVSLAQRRRAPF